MDDGLSIWVVIGVFSPIILWIIPHVPRVHQKFQLWGSKKTLNLISGLGLILTGLVMVCYSAYADAQMYSFTGFIIPFTTPSIPPLTTNQASIFGNFASFFATTLIIGGLAMVLGLFRMQKFQSLSTPTPDYIR